MLHLHHRALVPLFVMLLSAAMALSGCGGEETPTTGTPGAKGSGTPASGERPRIGVSVPAADHGWTAGVGYWAQHAMKAYPEIDWRYDTAPDTSEQEADIQTMKQRGIDSLVILAHQSEAMTPMAEELHEGGLFIVNVDRGFTEPVADVFIQGDNADFGRKSAEYMVKKMGGKGRIVLLRGSPSTVDKLRYDAAMKVFNAAPGIQVVDEQAGDWQREKAREAMVTMLQKNAKAAGGIDAVWASDDDMALGAEQAIREARREGEMWILGGAGMKDIIKRVRDGDAMYPADITYPPAMIAAGVHVAAGKALGLSAQEVHKRIPAHIGMTLEQVKMALAATHDAEQVQVNLPVQVVTPENAGEFYFEDSVY